jgi:hypothetical protein
MQPQLAPDILKLVCSCGITFEPLCLFDPELDEPLCDECAENMR